MLTMCSFTQPAQARGVLALQVATDAMMAATAATGAVVFVTGMWATLYHHCRFITEKNQVDADAYRRGRNQDAYVALAGGMLDRCRAD